MTKIINVACCMSPYTLMICATNQLRMAQAQGSREGAHIESVCMVHQTDLRCESFLRHTSWASLGRRQLRAAFGTILPYIQP